MTEETRRDKPLHLAQAITPETAPDPLVALEALFRDHHRQIYQAAYRITGRGEDAEDALQTVFLRLLRGGRAQDLAPSPGAYLHRAAVNAALDLVRARRGKQVALDDVEPRLADEPGRGPEEARAGSELEDRLRQAVTELPPRAAEICSLHFFEGHRNHEIARLLGTSRTTVAVTLHRARKKLRESLRDLAGDPS